MPQCFLLLRNSALPLRPTISGELLCFRFAQNGTKSDAHTPWRQASQASLSFPVSVRNFPAVILPAVLPGDVSQLSPSRSRPAQETGPPFLSLICFFKLVLILSEDELADTM